MSSTAFYALPDFQFGLPVAIGYDVLPVGVWNPLDVFLFGTGGRDVRVCCFILLCCLFADEQVTSC